MLEVHQAAIALGEYSLFLGIALTSNGHEFQQYRSSNFSFVCFLAKIDVLS